MKMGTEMNPHMRNVGTTMTCVFHGLGTEGQPYMGQNVAALDARKQQRTPKKVPCTSFPPWTQAPVESNFTMLTHQVTGLLSPFCKKSQIFESLKQKTAVMGRACLTQRDQMAAGLQSHGVVSSGPDRCPHSSCVKVTATSLKLTAG